MSEAKTYKVVVADDYRVSRMFLEAQVRENERCDLSASFSDADSAAEYCSAHDFDLVIMDVLMRSGSDGISVAAGIKKDDPDIKIILGEPLDRSGERDRRRELLVQGVQRRVPR